jgi:hypothetical protein
MSRSGVGEAFEFKEKRSLVSKLWRFCVYSWTIGRNGLVIWLVYLAFGKMESVFQKLVLAGLVLILVSVGDSRISILRTMIEEAYLHRSLFLSLQKKLDRNSTDSDERELDKLIKDFHKGDFVYSLNLAGAGITYLYVVWKVFSILALS